MRWLLLQLEMSAIRRGRALIGLRFMVHVALQNAEVSILYGGGGMDQNGCSVLWLDLKWIRLTRNFHLL